MASASSLQYLNPLLFNSTEQMPPHLSTLRLSLSLSLKVKLPLLKCRIIKAVRCHALITSEHKEKEKKKEKVFAGNGSSSGDVGVPVYVTLPLDTIDDDQRVRNRRAMDASLSALKSAGVEGVMVDVWWGLVERDAPTCYNWSGYKDLFHIIRSHHLKLQVIMSFHQCGGNFGDSCFIPLPRWVVEELDNCPDLAYTDRHGRRNNEYISLGCDSLPLLKGRTPIEVYADYMRSFRDNFKEFLVETIVEIQVGMGPAGELKYPSYHESNGTWRFPGIGEFQCYDKFMLASLRATTENAGKTSWGLGGPACDFGNLKIRLEESDIFRRKGRWSSQYQKFLLEWYTGVLLVHGEKILCIAEAIYRKSRVKISGKVGGIHWESLEFEASIDRNNNNPRGGYTPTVEMFGRHGVVLKFNCIGMRDLEDPLYSWDVVAAAREAGVVVAGDHNGLPHYDEDDCRKILRFAYNTAGDSSSSCAFTLLIRMNRHLFESEKWRRFVPFVRNMGQGFHFGGGGHKARANV